MTIHTIVVRPAATLPPTLLSVLAEEDRSKLAVIERADHRFFKLCTIADSPTQADELANSYAHVYGAQRA